MVAFCCGVSFSTCAFRCDSISGIVFCLVEKGDGTFDDAAVALIGVVVVVVRLSVELEEEEEGFGIVLEDIVGRGFVLWEGDGEMFFLSLIFVPAMSELRLFCSSLIDSGIAFEV